MATHDDAPLLRVVSGSPSPEELAAVVAVLAAAGSGGGGDVAPDPGLSRWSSREALVRRPLPVGPGAWRASGLPR
jgi:hypothetical protein